MGEIFQGGIEVGHLAGGRRRSCSVGDSSGADGLLGTVNFKKDKPSRRSLSFLKLLFCWRLRDTSRQMDKTPTCAELLLQAGGLSEAGCLCLHSGHLLCCPPAASRLEAEKLSQARAGAAWPLSLSILAINACFAPASCPPTLQIPHAGLCC